MKMKWKILLIVLSIPTVCIVVIAGILLSFAARPWPEPPMDYDDPESLYSLAERTEKYIMRANPDKDSPARKEALQVLEDIALLDVSYDEKARLIHERFPEESFWTDDLRDVLKQAEAGDAEAQFLLGCFYTPKKNLRSSDADPERGLCVMKSEPLAAKWFRKAALQGHAKAQFRLASRVGYLSCKNTEQSSRRLFLVQKEEEEWFAKAGANGEPDALLRGYGPKEKYATEDQCREAGQAFFREAAEHGDVDAMCTVGSCLWYSNPVKSAEMYRRAAELGSLTGIFHYAELLEMSAWCETDTPEVEAARMLRQKAFDAAMERLNEGSAEDLNTIFPTLFTLSRLDELIRRESREEFVNRVVLRLWELIEQGDYEDAPAFIFSLYREFRITGIDELDPDTLCRHFAELGFYREQENHADLLRRHREPEVRDEGIRLFRTLAGFGYIYAQRQLAEFYWNGDCLPQDRAEGIKWMRMAAEQRNCYAMQLLSMYLLQTGNRYEALEWSCMARAVDHGRDSYLEYLFDSTMERIKDLPSRVWKHLGKFALWLFE